jgi:hypothetical protein
LAHPVLVVRATDDGLELTAWIDGDRNRVVEVARARRTDLALTPLLPALGRGPGRVPAAVELTFPRKPDLKILATAVSRVLSLPHPFLSGTLNGVVVPFAIPAAR